MPLRDSALVQFMLSVPDHLLQQGVETRPVLRDATRGLIPEEVRLRRGKAGFYDVFDRGMATENLRWTKNLLLDPDALWRGFIEEVGRPFLDRKLSFRRLGPDGLPARDLRRALAAGARRVAAAFSRRGRLGLRVRAPRRASKRSAAMASGARAYSAAIRSRLAARSKPSPRSAQIRTPVAFNPK